MLNYSLQFCKDNSLTQLSLWANETLPIYRFFLDKGFKEFPTETYFIIKSFSDNIDKQLINNFNNWYITMGDSDIF